MLETAGREFEHMARQMRGMMDELMRRQMSVIGRGDAWSPAINVYHVQDRLEVCVELAGVERQSIEVDVEPGRLTVRGRRHAPQPRHADHEAIRVLTMEIDHGPFERVIELAQEVEVNGVDAELQAGLLWIRLPLRR